MKVLRNISIIYEPKENIDIREVRQGDIFKNIPYIIVTRYVFLI